MSKRYRPVPSQLFTLRVWQEVLDGGRAEWRGRVQHVLTGEAHYFRDWQMLIGQLESILAGIESNSSAPPTARQAGRPERP